LETKPKQEKKKIEDENFECESEMVNESNCSKNSLTAKAEEIFRTDNKIKMALEIKYCFTHLHI